MQSQMRHVFARQPAHILLVDYQPPFDDDVSEYLYQSLEDIFALVTNLNGPCRAPLFGLFALGSYPENLFQLQYVKNNFARLHSALEELKFFTKDSKGLPDSKTKEILQQGMQDAITQFKRHSQSHRQISTASSQLEICILTCGKAIHLARKIEEISKRLELGNIKKIQIASVNRNVGDEDQQGDDPTRDQDTSPSSSTETGISGCGIVDTVTLLKDPISFQSFFKTWLLDCETDQEHIRIELPNPYAIMEQEFNPLEEPKDLVLKCDLHERLVNPANLPFRSQFQLNTENVSSIKTSSTGTKASPCVMSYPVHTMTVDKLIKREAICESLIFGMPYIARPTVCWKLDWEELESNQQYFLAFCNTLEDRGLAALLKIKPTCGTRAGQQQARLPIGYFILLPSHGSTMLLKSIATNDLLLPTDFNQPLDGPTNEATEFVAASIDQLPIEDSFNPVFVKSGLYASLASLSLKGIKATRPVKRGFQAPQKFPQETCRTSTGMSGPPQCRTSTGMSGPPQCRTSTGMSGSPQCRTNTGMSGPPQCRTSTGMSGPPQCRTNTGMSGPPQCKPSRAFKRVVFSKDSNKTTSIKRSRTAPALDIYVSSPTDLTDES